MEVVNVQRYLHLAFECMEQRDYGQAYALFILIIQLRPELKSALEESFCDAWAGWSNKLVTLNKLPEVLKLYESGNDCFPECEGLHLTMGNIFFKLGLKVAAHEIYKSLVNGNPKNMAARENYDNLCRSIIDNWHYEMLNDFSRNHSFYKAITDCISTKFEEKSGKSLSIVDIGSGTGLLSMFCLQCKNVTVIACESDPVMSKFGKDIVSGNAFKDNIKFYDGPSTDLSVQESNPSAMIAKRASIAVCEIFDSGLFGEGVIPSIDHAWKELLVPSDEGGMVIPSKAIVSVTCIQCEQIHKSHCGGIASQSEVRSILMTSNIGIENSDIPSFQSLVSDCEPYTCERVENFSYELLTGSKILTEVNFNNAAEISSLASEKRSVDVELYCTRKGFLDAVVMSFDLVLDSNYPSKYTIRTHIGSDSCWEQTIYPIRHLHQNHEKVKFSRTFIEEGTRIVLKFLQCPDKLILNSCVISNDDKTLLLPQTNISDASKEDFLVLCVEEHTNIKMNDALFFSLIDSALSSSCNENDPNQCISVIESSSSCPLLAISLALKYPMLTVHQQINQDQVTKNLIHRIGLANFVITENDHVPNQQFNLIYVDMVEHNGMLNDDAIYSLIKERHFLCNRGHIFPSKLRIMAMIIESVQLLKRCTVIDDSATIGLKIGSYLCQFQPMTLSHLNMQNVAYKSLSSPIVCEEITFKDYNLADFESKCFSFNTTVHGGIAHGVLLWYAFAVNDEVVFDTLSSDNSWRQCVLMQSNFSDEIAEKSNFCLEYNRKFGYIAIDIKEISRNQPTA